MLSYLYTQVVVSTKQHNNNKLSQKENDFRNKVSKRKRKEEFKAHKTNHYSISNKKVNLMNQTTRTIIMNEKDHDDVALLDWFVATTTTSTPTTTTGDNHINIISNTSSSTFIHPDVIVHHEEQIKKQPYDVNMWLQYFDTIDELIINATNTTTSTSKTSGINNNNNMVILHNIQYEPAFTILIAIRELISRRSITLLPRSYKLYKNIFEFLIRIQKQQQNTQTQIQQETTAAKPNTNTKLFHITDEIIVSYFQQCFITLSMYPRIWIFYLQWYMERIDYYDSNLQQNLQSTQQKQHLQKCPSYISATNLRHIIDQSLSSIAIAQHEKIWNVITPWLYEYHNHQKDNPDDNENDYNNTNKKIIPLETIYRILKRYCQYKPSSLFQFGQWCEQHSKYYGAAQIYQQILNQTYNTTTTTTSSSALYSPEDIYTCWILFCDLMIQHSEIMEQMGIPWEQIIRTAILQQLGHKNRKSGGGGGNGPSNSRKNQKNNNSSNSNATNQETTTRLIQTIVEATNAPIGGSGSGTMSSTTQSSNDPSSSSVGTGTTSNHHNHKLLLGLLYTKLATSWMVRGEFELARTVYEEGLRTVTSIRDFTILYSSYLQLEDEIVTALVQSLEEDDEEENDNNEENDDATNEEITTTTEDDYDILLAYDDDDDDDQYDNKKRRKSNSKMESKMISIELALARAEYLTNRRPLLLNGVKLRSNPYVVTDWLERAQYYIDQKHQQSQSQSLEQASMVLEEALGTLSTSNYNTTSDSSSVVIKKKECTLHPIVQELMNVYEILLKDVNRAIDMFQRVCFSCTTEAVSSSSSRFGLPAYVYRVANMEDGAQIWTEYIELLLRNEMYDTALSIARQSIHSTMYGQGQQQQSQSQNQRKKLTTSTTTATYIPKISLKKSLRLWDLLFDLEESLGTVQSTKDIYQHAFDEKIVTIQHVLNYAHFLQDQQYYEESFAIYERGIDLFDYKIHRGTKLVWQQYFHSFLQRYGTSETTKIERTRNLFDRCLESCHEEDRAEFYTLYGEYEEKFGLTKRALSVYRDMCRNVPDHDKYNAYQLFILKTIKYLGVTATREIYEEAIQTIQDKKSFCQIVLDYAHMEMHEQLQQIDRARTLYEYGCHQADPKQLPEYWQQWNDFEIEYGNEDTFREMLRMKRHVEAMYSTVNYNSNTSNTNSKTNSNNQSLSNKEAMRMIAASEGIEVAALLDDDEVDDENIRTALAGFVPATAGQGTISTSSSDPQQQQATIVTSKRGIQNLQEVEERVAKLRKVTGRMNNDNNDNEQQHEDEDADANEIDIDDIDAEIMAAAREGTELANVGLLESVTTTTTNMNDDDDDNNDNEDNNTGYYQHQTTVVKDVTTKAVPQSVFGGLRREING